MGNGPAPFSNIGRRARDLLATDYYFDQKFSLMMWSGTGMALNTTGVKKNQSFVGEIISQYKGRRTLVEVKVNTSSNISTTVAVDEVFPDTRVLLSFKIPDHKYVKLDVWYRHARAAINSSIGLNPTPLLEFSAAVGTKQISLGAEVGFDTKSSSFRKCNAGIGLNTNDFSASVMLAEKGKTLKASYIHVVNPNNGAAVAAEMTHNLSTYKNSFTIGSACFLNRFTMVKARYTDSGKAAMLCRHEWRPQSLITFSAEYDPKAADSAAKFGLQLHLKPMQ